MFWKPTVISKIGLTPPKAASTRAPLAICLIVKNEETHIGEWANFHIRAGVDHIIVYDNGCTDQTIPILRDTLGEKTTVIPWDQKLFDARSKVEIHNQVLAYAHCLRNFGGGYRWMAFIDVDEFMVPMATTSLPDALAALDNHAQVSLPWHMFGRGGFDQPPAGGILPNYTARMRDPLASEHALNWKCIVDPARVTGVRVHGFDIEGAAIGVNDAGLLAKHDDRKNRAFYSNAAIQLNHYYTRSNAELQAKINRGSNKTVQSARHIKRVMRIVDAIEKDTVGDTSVADYLARRAPPPLP